MTRSTRSPGTSAVRQAHRRAIATMTSASMTALMAIVGTTHGMDFVGLPQCCRAQSSPARKSRTEYPRVILPSWE